MLSNSMMDGCFGIAPISSSFCVIDTAFAPVPAGVLVAGEAADGAAEVSEAVWLWGADTLLDSVLLDGEVGASGVSVGCVIVGTGTTGAGAGIAGIETADVALSGLIGLTGLSTLVGFVTDFTQESELVTHAPNNRLP